MHTPNWQGVRTPYRMRNTVPTPSIMKNRQLRGMKLLPSDRGWIITCGVSGVLVAGGSDWSRPIGRQIMAMLEDKHFKRRAKRMPIKGKVV